jgi:hypothetical protein
MHNFGSVHSIRITVDLLHKHFPSSRSTSCNRSVIMTNCSCANKSQSDITACVNNLFSFFTSDFTLVCVIFCQFFTCVVPCDLDLCVLLIFVPKASSDDRGITWDTCSRRSFATSLSRLKIWHFLIIGIEGNVCRCASNRYSVITQFAKLAAGERSCRRFTH